MKICVPNSASPGVKTKAQAVSFGVVNINAAVDFAENHKDKRVYVTTAYDVPTISPKQMLSLAQNIPNLYFSFVTLNDLIQFAQMPGATHFMGEPEAQTWALIQIYKYYHVSDIKIGGELCFQQNLIAREVRRHGILVHMNPCLVIPSAINCVPAITCPWVLPQHAHLYSSTIDYFDVRPDLAAMYLDESTYDGPWAMLSPTLSSIDVPVNYVDEKWVKRRLNCSQSCVSNHHCHHCITQTNMYGVLKHDQEKHSNT